MEVTLEAVSPYGIKYGGNEKWTNLTKGHELSEKLKEKFHAGDVVNITQNSGGFISEIELVTSAPPKKAWGGKSFTPRDPQESVKKGRGAAVKAVLESPIVFEHVKNDSIEKAMVEIFRISDMVADYIEKGR